MKTSSADKLNDYIDELGKKASMESWNSFVKELQVPNELAAALITGRHQLMPPPKELTKEECARVYEIIGTLVGTNAALRLHAQELAHQVNIWTQAFKQLETVGRRVEHFANFRRTDESLNEDEDA